MLLRGVLASPPKLMDEIPSNLVRHNQTKGDGGISGAVRAMRLPDARNEGGACCASKAGAGKMAAACFVSRHIVKLLFSAIRSSVCEPNRRRHHDIEDFLTNSF